MNCQRFRKHLGNSSEDALMLGHLSSEMLAHINGCSDCKKSLEQRRELALGLQRIRKAAPAVPEAVDAAVLMAFRKRLATQHDEVPRYQRTGRPAMFSYRAAVIAAVGMLIFFLLPGERAVPRIETARAPQPEVTNEAPGSASRSTPNRAFSQSTRNIGKKIHQHSYPRKATDDHTLLSPGFASLMYCDRLSCAGEMEIVRVQVSPSMLGVPAARPDKASPVLADVLVGPDGIARGIRFEQ